MQTLLQNLRFSLRMLARNPGMTITVLLTLAIGIGANTAIFTVDYATLLAPLPYPWTLLSHSGCSCFRSGRRDL